jgi:hypothetical protein
MLKKTITYEDFNGDMVTEDHHFHLSKADLVELEMSRPGGLSAYLQNIVNSEDGVMIMKEFKELLLKSYGIRTPDGKRFLKNDEIRDGFASSEAYSAVFMELIMDAEAASAFVNGIVPSSLNADMAKLEAKKATVEAPPTPPKKPRVITQEEAREMNAVDLKNLIAQGATIAPATPKL